MFNAVLVMVILGVFIGVILGVANIYFYVPNDEKLDTINAMLPGLNCGGCGFTGCSGFAQGIVDGEINSLSKCRPCSAAKKAEILEYLKNEKKSNGEDYQVTL